MKNDFKKEEKQHFVVHRKWKWNKSLIQQLNHIFV